ncbi:MAG TPA: YggT family protein [Candidatus Limnocylindrales bacterium]|nr:YggT family protein [Candidatus Limnocylindrales bacterium]
MGALVANFLQAMVMALWLLVLGRVIVSWVDPRGSNKLSQFLVQATEPLLAPIRRMLPQTGMVDFSPLILMLILGAVLTVVRV